MRKTLPKWVSYAIAVIIISYCLPLQGQRNCGTMEHLEELIRENPEIYENRKAIEKATQEFITDQNKAVTGIVQIPVVVHVVYNTSTENISTAQINSQIDVLNADFRRMNSDANNNWPQAADTEIEFCLATVDPSGNSTTGITRTSTSVSSFSTNDNVKFNSSGGKDAWPASQYLNIWVCDLGGGLLGYAQFPGGPANTDGVVVDYQYFGTTGTATPPFDLGRTTTHEVGHWLNLYHIWGDGPCSVDDLVGDTPSSDNANYGCPAGHSSCGSTDMIENYMDYTDDSCMNLYTSGQTDRMRALFDTNGFRESLLNSPGCGQGPTPSCTDGIQNGNETGVDCGGPDCPPCQTGCTENLVSLSITLDNYPEETSWTIVNSNNTVVASGGPYGNQAPGSTVTEEFCLPNGCYDFTINDSYGDGICCAYGNGSYNLTDVNNNVLASGGNFGSSETTNFCLGSAGSSCTDGIQNGSETGVDCGGPDCSPCQTGCTENTLMLDIVFDDYPEETSWEIVDGNNSVIVSGGPYGSQSPGSSVTEGICLPNGCYEFIIYDSYGDGICCAYGAGSYTLTDNNNNTLASGGTFGSIEITPFCAGSPGSSCSDGIQNGSETGMDCGGPDCPPCQTGCSYQTINSHGFENGWGIWNNGGADCRRNINDWPWANSGDYCIRLRDNTNSSVMTTDNLNLSGYSELTIDFSFIAASMEQGEDFWLQISTNGGTNYQTVASWARGTDFQNNVREFPMVVIGGTFTSNTRIRFRNDASDNSDRIYIDDVTISGCYNGNTREEVEIPVAETVTEYPGSEMHFKCYPNPAIDQLNIEYYSPLADSEMVILDISGQLLLRKPISASNEMKSVTVDITSLQAGLYFIHIVNEKDRLVEKFTVLR